MDNKNENLVEAIMVCVEEGNVSPKCPNCGLELVDLDEIESILFDGVEVNCFKCGTRLTSKEIVFFPKQKVQN
jgi:hypothetical protein